MAEHPDPIMANTALYKDTFEDLRLLPPEAPDRLPAMLFLAALLHGILIIGVTFNPQLVDEFANAISLEVTIVADPDQRIDRPDDADYLAQASQQGGGNTSRQARPSAPLESASPFANPGEFEGDSVLDATPHELAADQVVATRSEQALSVVDELREQPRTESSRALALEAGSERTLPLPQEDQATLLIHDDDPRQLIVSADTRESAVAAYVDNWKRRIEAVGDEYFPELGNLEGLTGSPTLEVGIEASGQLTRVIIRRSSGSTVLDQAALDILRRAAPFDPFPDDVAADYDRLLFVYKWLFSEELIPASASLN